MARGECAFSTRTGASFTSGRGRTGDRGALGIISDRYRRPIVRLRPITCGPRMRARLCVGRLCQIENCYISTICKQYCRMQCPPMKPDPPVTNTLLISLAHRLRGEACPIRIVAISVYAYHPFGEALTISVRYLGSSVSSSLRLLACSSGLGFGGDEVRLSTGMPMAMNNSSCPAGVHTQSIWTVLSDMFLNWWGAFAGMLTVDPARTRLRLAAEEKLELAFQHREHLLEIVAM